MGLGVIPAAVRARLESGTALGIGNSHLGIGDRGARGVGDSSADVAKGCLAKSGKGKCQAENDCHSQVQTLHLSLQERWNKHGIRVPYVPRQMYHCAVPTRAIFGKDPVRGLRRSRLPTTCK